LSPNNTRREIDERLKDFFESGTRLAWIIDPEARRVEVCRSMVLRQLVGSGGFLDGEELLAGFRYPVADLFKEWEWD
jgi:Uma2 family endonuclease